MPERDRSGAGRPAPPRETIVVHKGHGLPYSKGLMAQALSATALSQERSFELARMIEARLDEGGEGEIDVEALHALVEDVLQADDLGRELGDCLLRLVDFDETLAQVGDGLVGFDRRGAEALGQTVRGGGEALIEGGCEGALLLLHARLGGGLLFAKLAEPADQLALALNQAYQLRIGPTPA